MIDWNESPVALRALDGWIGDVPFFRIYTRDKDFEVAAIRNLHKLGTDAEEDGEFMYVLLDGMEYATAEEAKRAAEEWLRTRILERMELVKNPEILRIEKIIN